MVPDRHAELVTLRDKTCVFPWCSRPARRCDKDHSIPHNKGGPTCPCNLAPLCRRHHRIKTHGAWTYRTIEPGTYLWTSQARLPVPPRHRRHPRRLPRPAPATRLAPPPHTPPTGGAIPMPAHRMRLSTATTAVDPSRSRAGKQPASSAATEAASHQVTRKSEATGDRVRPRQARPTYLAALPNLTGFEARRWRSSHLNHRCVRCRHGCCATCSTDERFGGLASTSERVDAHASPLARSAATAADRRARAGGASKGAVAPQRAGTTDEESGATVTKRRGAGSTGRGRRPTATTRPPKPALAQRGRKRS